MRICQCARDLAFFPSPPPPHYTSAMVGNLFSIEKKVLSPKNKIGQTVLFSYCFFHINSNRQLNTN